MLAVWLLRSGGHFLCLFSSQLFSPPLPVFTLARYLLSRVNPLAILTRRMLRCWVDSCTRSLAPLRARRIYAISGLGRWSRTGTGSEASRGFGSPSSCCWLRFWSEHATSHAFLIPLRCTIFMGLGSDGGKLRILIFWQAWRRRRRRKRKRFS